MWPALHEKKNTLKVDKKDTVFPYCKVIQGILFDEGMLITDIIKPLMSLLLSCRSLMASV